MAGVRPQQMANEFGFTLVELLGVMVILIILSLMSIQVWGNVSDRARWTRSRSELGTIETALERFNVDHGHYPMNLGTLITRGYIKANTTFESPWSSSDRRIYYFYAVHTPSNSQALSYALGDPGPKATCTSTTLYADAGIPLPCGHHPFNEIAFLFSSGRPDLDLTLAPPSLTPVQTLSQFRSSCRGVQESGFATGSGCDLRTES